MIYAKMYQAAPQLQGGSQKTTSHSFYGIVQVSKMCQLSAASHRLFLRWEVLCVFLPFLSPFLSATLLPGLGIEG